MEIIKFLVHAYLYFLFFEFLIEKRNKYFRWIFILIFGTATYMLEFIMNAKYLLPLILCTSLILYGECVQSKHTNLQHLEYTLVTYGMDLMLNVVLGSICGFIGGVFGIGGKNWISVCATIGRIIFIILLNESNAHLEKVKQAWVMYIAVAASIIAVFVEQILSVAYETKNYGFVDIGLVCIYIAALFTTLWFLDHHKMLKIQKAYAADNKQMSQKLHRSKEVLPLIVDYVSNFDEVQDEEMRQKLEEVCHDYGKELNDWEMYTGLFNTTGIKFLDLLLQKKMRECEEQDIEMEVFVSTQIDEDMKRLGVSDGELLRMMGDLLRNAMNAVQEANTTEALILVVVARNEYGNVEFHVHDSGIPFPEGVLEKLGERGNTTWGTGNGIADLMESLRRVDASIEIISEPDPDDIFTKEICICFDGKGTIKIGHGQASA